MKLIVKVRKTINRQYWLSGNCDLTVNMKKKLITSLFEKNQVFCCVKQHELFDILYETHRSIGHGGRDRMRKEL